MALISPGSPVFSGDQEKKRFGEKRLDWFKSEPTSPPWLGLINLFQSGI